MSIGGVLLAGDKRKYPYYTYVFDLDGTICTQETEKNWRKAKPYWDVIIKMNELYMMGNTIYIYTARHMKTHKETLRWLKEHNVLFDHIFYGKPTGPSSAYTFYIDDRARNLEDL